MNFKNCERRCRYAMDSRSGRSRSGLRSWYRLASARRRTACLSACCPVATSKIVFQRFLVFFAQTHSRAQTSSCIRTAWGHVVQFSRLLSSESYVTKACGRWTHCYELFLMGFLQDRCSTIKDWYGLILSVRRHVYILVYVRQDMFVGIFVY